MPNCETIGEIVFSKCEKLEFINDMTKVKAIGEAAFFGAKNYKMLRYLTLKLLKKIKFYDCPKLQKININNVEIIKKEAFSFCKI